jgi:hypothetical protein
MKRLFNIFKKNREPKRFINTKDTYDSELMRYTINGKKYAVVDSQVIKIQSVADDVQVYGWTLEFRYKNMNGEWYGWSTYWNHKIYVSRSSALDAASKIPKNFGECEWRISPLYKMNEPQYREYKIDQLLTDKPKDNAKVYEIKAWKVKEDCEILYEISKQTYKYKKGTLFIQMEDGNIKSIKDQTTGISYSGKFQLFNNLIKEDKVEEVNIKDEKWVHPHLCRELKIKIKK